jgi:hypothetical protein
MNKNNTNNINPNYITGLTDGDGSFSVGIYSKPDSKLGWTVKLRFLITAGYNPTNYIMLQNIQQFFGGIGNINIKPQDNTCNYIVNSLPELKIIQQHFINYPLCTYKLVYFQLWSEVLNIISLSGKLTLELLLKIIAFKSHFKLGVSDSLLEAFPNNKSITIPNYSPNLSIIDFHWLAGFINSDGSFSLTVSKEKSRKLGEACGYYISITQNEISKIVLDYIAEFLGYGKVYYQAKGVYVYKINSKVYINDFINKFEEAGAKIQGAKALDYIDFCKGINIVNNKTHLTREGLEDFRALTKGMNSTRTYFGK